MDAHEHLESGIGLSRVAFRPNSSFLIKKRRIVSNGARFTIMSKKFAFKMLPDILLRLSNIGCVAIAGLIWKSVLPIKNSKSAEPARHLPSSNSSLIEGPKPAGY